MILATSRNGDFTTFLGSLFQCVTNVNAGAAASGCFCWSRVNSWDVWSHEKVYGGLCQLCARRAHAVPGMSELVFSKWCNSENVNCEFCLSWGVKSGGWLRAATAGGNGAEFLSGGIAAGCSSSSS